METAKGNPTTNRYGVSGVDGRVASIGSTTLLEPAKVVELQIAWEQKRMFHLLRRLYIIQVFTKSLTHEIKCDESYRGADGADNQTGGRDAIHGLERDK